MAIDRNCARQNSSTIHPSPRSWRTRRERYAYRARVLPLALCVTLVSARGAHAQGYPPIAGSEDEPREPRFGQAGQVAISGAFSFDLGRTSYTETDQTAFMLEVSPAAHYFVSSNVSIGGSIFTRYTELSIPLGGQDSIDGSTFAYGVAANLGLNLPTTDRVSFWPRLSLGVWTEKLSAPSGFGLSQNRNGAYVPYRDLRETAVWTQLWVPVLFHAAPHFFLGFGPLVTFDLWHAVDDFTNRRLFFGASSTVGGWF
jgi:hypothetical protein